MKINIILKEVRFDMEGQGLLTSKAIGILAKYFDCFGPNLMVLTGTCDVLSRRQKKEKVDGHTNTQTDAGNNNNLRAILASVNMRKY